MKNMASIAWRRANAHNDSKKFSRIHDVILYYVKNHKKRKWNPLYLPVPSERYSHVEDDGRRYQTVKITTKGLHGRGYEYEWKEMKKIWIYPRRTMERLEKENRLYYTRSGIPRRKIYMGESKGRTLSDFWNDIRLTSDEKVGYMTQKPEKLLERVIEVSSDEGDIVLDAFCGSGTTLVAAKKLKREFIGIDINRGPSRYRRNGWKIL